MNHVFGKVDVAPQERYNFPTPGTSEQGNIEKQLPFLVKGPELLIFFYFYRFAIALYCVGLALNGNRMIQNP